MNSSSEDSTRSSLISIQLSDVFGLGKAAEQLSPAAGKVVEALVKLPDPGLSAAKIYLDARARGAAERHETTKNLKQISAVDNILASDPQLAEAMKARLISTEMRRQANIHAAIQKAVAIADTRQNNESLTDLDQDFVQEWVEGVKDISNDEVQKIWSNLLAAAPNLPAGRVSKPAFELLKLFDQPTANCFWEFAKIWSSVGFPSVKAPSNWAPFGTPIRLKLLLELGVVEEQVYSAMQVPYLGRIKQIDRRNKSHLLNTMQVFVWGQRAMELSEVIFAKPFDIDEELVRVARSENLGWLANDKFWSLEISRQDAAENEFRYLITSIQEQDNPVQEAVTALEADPSIDGSWKQVLMEYAMAGRMIIPAAP